MFIQALENQTLEESTSQVYKSPKSGKINIRLVGVSGTASIWLVRANANYGESETNLNTSDEKQAIAINDLDPEESFKFVIRGVDINTNLSVWFAY